MSFFNPTYETHLLFILNIDCKFYPFKVLKVIGTFKRYVEKTVMKITKLQFRKRTPRITEEIMI